MGAPAQPALGALRVRARILGNIASFNPSKNAISIMFHRGSQIPGRHPRLEGDGKLVRTIRFADLAEVEKERKDLERAVRAWCDWKAGS